MRTTSGLAVVASLLFSVPAMAAVQLFDGRQAAMFRGTNFTTACGTALNMTLNCPATIKYLTYPDHAIAWNSTMLDSLCSTACVASTATLVTNLNASCQADRYATQTSNMTFAEFGELIAYRTSQLCLKNTGVNTNYCHLAWSSWDIPSLATKTWPSVPPKWYFPSPGVNKTLPVRKRANDTTLAIPAWQFSQAENGTFGPNDIWLDRSQALAKAQRHSAGWNEQLNWDEYPLEIQCQPCFWKTFSKGHTNKWGSQIWEEIKEQQWANMVRNCNISAADAAIVAYKNLTGTYFNTVDDLGSVAERDFSRCPSNFTVPETSTDTCREFARKNNVTSAGLRSLNPFMPCSRVLFPGTKLCMPLTCSVMVVPNIISVQDFVASGAIPGGVISINQFLRWNIFLTRHDTIVTNDTVCTGPPMGRYTPVVAPLATPTVFTTTAIAAHPTPSGTIPNCGLWYTIIANSTCAEMSVRFRISFSQLIDLNPSINTVCSNLIVGDDYCVTAVNGTIVPHQTTTRIASTTSSTTRPPTTSSTTSRTSTTSTTTYPAPPAPTQAGSTAQCRKWYVVLTGQGCWDIQQANAVTFAQLQSWNTYINAACTNLWANSAVCVAGP